MTTEPFKPFPVPGDHFDCATPTDEGMIKLLGGHRFQSVVFTRDQMKWLAKFYDYNTKHTEQAVEEVQAAFPAALAAWEKELAEADTSWARKGIEKRKPKRPNPEDTRMLHQAGADVALLRHADRDGLRLMAFLARFLEAGQDPVKLVAQLAIEAGLDVGGCCEWAYEEDEDEVAAK